jgi:uncharacterized integral membrane protein
MVGFSFKKSDLAVLIVIALLAFVGAMMALPNQDRVRFALYTATLGLQLLNVFVLGYFNSRRNARELQRRLRIEAQPLVELKAQLINELTSGRVELTNLENKVGNLKVEAETLSKLASLDEAMLRAILLRTPRGTKREVWTERSFGFAIGIAASLLASVVYDAVK